jgi:hypothetical protein
MLAAIIPHGDEAWFFKLTGPDTAAGSQAEAFEQLVKSVQLPEGSGDPKWDLPSGWVQKPGNAMRFATLELDAGGEKLECTVSRLPGNEANWEDYVLANVNRWRGQLSLPQIAATDLSRETKAVELTGGKAAVLINIVGESSGSGMGGAPFAGTGTRPPFAASASRSAATSSAKKISYKAPSGWTPGELQSSRSGFSVPREAVFEVKDGKQRVEITVTKLPGSAGGTLQNVNRWRGQIGLEDISAEQLEKDKKQLDLAGKPADYVQFSGSDQTVLGVLAARDGQTWFIKLQGHNELAARERQNFEEFVQSIKFN